MKRAIDIFRFLRDAAARGERTVLVTLTDVIGSASRTPGEHMAVSESGAYAGSLSGGCVEAAIVAETLAVLERGAAELVRFGAGSRYIDIRLPCGGGIDLLFTPEPDAGAVGEALALLNARRPVTIRLRRFGAFDLPPAARPGWQEGHFVVRHDADVELVIVGHGVETLALARLADCYGAAVRVLSPDAALVEQVRRQGGRATHLLTPASVSGLTADDRSAIVFLFHDHDWEAELMLAALDTPALFIGAMGSRATHDRRCAALLARGAAVADVARIVGPVGAIEASRDPDTLALSILAQVVAEHEEIERGDRCIRTNTAELMNEQHELMPA